MRVLGAGIKWTDLFLERKKMYTQNPDSQARETPGENKHHAFQGKQTDYRVWGEGRPGVRKASKEGDILSCPLEGRGVCQAEEEGQAFWVSRDKANGSRLESFPGFSPQRD